MRKIQLYWLFPLFITALTGAVVLVIDYQVSSFREAYFAALEQEIILRNRLMVGVCKAMIERKLAPEKMYGFFEKQPENPHILRIKKLRGKVVFETASHPNRFHRMLSVPRIRSIMRGPANDDVFFEYNPYHKTYFAYNAIRFSCGNGEYVLIMAEQCDSVTRLVRLSEFAIFVFSTTGILVALGLIIYFLRQVRSPLKRLKVSTRAIASGDFDYPVYVPRSGVVKEIAISVRDMAEHLKGQIVQLKMFETQRRELFGAISHAMKTPLTGILSAAEGIEHGALENPEYRNECITAIKLQSARLSGLLHDFLDLNTIETLEAGKDREFLPLYISELLREASESFHHHAACPEFIFEGVDDEKELSGNPVLIVQAFENLFSNSIMHGNATKILCRIIDKGSAYIIDVCDNGSGIKPADRERIFERFYSSRSTKKQPIPGNGLGLVIVKRIIEFHNGTIETADADEQWSTVFRITIPIA